MDEVQIRTGILTNDRKALRRFYRTYVPGLRRFILRKVARKEDAEEILSDTLYAFLEALRDFHGKSSLKTFLYAICRNKVVDYYRRKKIRHVVFSQVPQIDSFVSTFLDPEAAYDESVMRERIRISFERILPSQKRILHLKYADNLSVSDIASHLRISFKSAESRLFRARRAFAEAFVRE